MLVQTSQKTRITFAALAAVLMVSLVLATQVNLFVYKDLAVGITYDLTFTAPLLYFLLIRKTRIPNTTVVPFFIANLVLANYLLPPQLHFHLNLVKQFIVPFVELSVLGFVIYKITKVRQHYRQNKTTHFDFFSTLKTALTALMPPSVVSAFATELGVFYYGFIHWKKLVAGPHQFSYHKKSGTQLLLGVLMFMVGVECFVLHILLAQWSIIAAWILTGLSIYSAIQFLGFARSLSKRPIVLTETQLFLHYGIMSETTIDLDNIATITLLNKSFKANQQSRLLSPLGELEKPNISITLKNQGQLTGLYGFKKTFQTIGFHVDDAMLFKQALEDKLTLH